MKKEKIIKTIVVQTVISILMLGFAFSIGEILKKQCKG